MMLNDVLVSILKIYFLKTILMLCIAKNIKIHIRLLIYKVISTEVSLTEGTQRYPLTKRCNR